MPPATRLGQLLTRQFGEFEAGSARSVEGPARNVEGPEEAYGPDYYAVFFEDPEGNKLEVCCID